MRNIFEMNQQEIEQEIIEQVRKLDGAREFAPEYVEGLESRIEELERALDDF